ncbi:MAG: hypothetical protein A2747_03985 [Candidatus Yonathbacteria bacterium RIFCSPHIGHO2_01_FULL_44_41]|uniref:Type 4 fimbrial biogenesis protein PilO n=1 Tax=Candidatus Yonathbacteria bacterium RIFCSPHIGHO2_02_FULL_44_14 TaxID=1802724 RepID=A0A1G2S7K8_9BACT|nr:MAG: hypothetical protein A2747_03985 [Candidatus Yonathbacteria bacterium RIFCSPHIGHO2_01_FULL_44_41]OHA81080.1 MAG: hypothetical protein A3D51_01875 [Candidatus Yonathbacteria bacterium RIFCSPHIGHO2_02_FULL_44_14]OHA81303.1 MAG: hypothetical protein A3B06_03585 [Candidatus Yonathbacteria bacterium RIFCSPLOWO2_01_FULL_43_20]
MFTTKNLFTLVTKYILIAFAVVLFTSGVVFFLSGQITKVSNRTAKDRQLVTMLSERTAVLSNLKHDTDIIGANESTIKQAFIPSNNILEFVAAFENLASKNGLTQAFHFSSPTTMDTGSPITLTTIGYQNNISSNVSVFINYLKDFERLPYFTKIDSINISSGKEGWYGTAAISFSATIIARSTQ